MLIAVKNHLKICVWVCKVWPVSLAFFPIMPSISNECAMGKQFSNLSKSTFLCSCKYWLEQIWSDVSLSPHNFSAMDKKREFCKYFAVANNHSLTPGWKGANGEVESNECWREEEKKERSTRQIFALTGFYVIIWFKKIPHFSFHSNSCWVCSSLLASRLKWEVRMTTKSHLSAVISMYYAVDIMQNINIINRCINFEAGSWSII